jgi:hypothetical protein
MHDHAAASCAGLGGGHLCVDARAQAVLARNLSTAIAQRAHSVVWHRWALRSRGWEGEVPATQCHAHMRASNACSRSRLACGVARLPLQESPLAGAVVCCALSAHARPSPPGATGGRRSDRLLAGVGQHSDTSYAWMYKTLPRCSRTGGHGVPAKGTCEQVPRHACLSSRGSRAHGLYVVALTRGRRWKLAARARPLLRHPAQHHLWFRAEPSFNSVRYDWLVTAASSMPNCARQTRLTTCRACVRHPRGPAGKAHRPRGAWTRFMALGCTGGATAANLQWQTLFPRRPHN